jgi:hypothetical protein
MALKCRPEPTLVYSVQHHFSDRRSAKLSTAHANSGQHADVGERFRARSSPVFRNWSGTLWPRLYLKIAARVRTMAENAASVFARSSSIEASMPWGGVVPPIVDDSSGSYSFRAPELFAASAFPDDPAPADGKVEFSSKRVRDVVFVTPVPGIYEVQGTHFPHSLLGMNKLVCSASAIERSNRDDVYSLTFVSRRTRCASASD